MPTHTARLWDVATLHVRGGYVWVATDHIVFNAARFVETFGRLPGDLRGGNSGELVAALADRHVNGGEIDPAVYSQALIAGFGSVSPKNALALRYILAGPAGLLATGDNPESYNTREV